jgi:hypothetical protein
LLKKTLNDAGLAAKDVEKKDLTLSFLQMNES